VKGWLQIQPCHAIGSDADEGNLIEVPVLIASPSDADRGKGQGQQKGKGQEIAALEESATMDKGRTLHE